MLICKIIFNFFFTEITCDVGLTPFNGGSESCDRSNNFGSVCSYTCNEGYDLKGASQRECEENGDWSEERPSCDGGLKLDL